MRRDLDLARSILVTVEKSDGPVGSDVLSGCCDDLGTVAFHVELMRENGLIRADVTYDGFGETPMDVNVSGMTWDGYDCLDAIRSEFWNSVELTGNQTCCASEGPPSRRTPKPATSRGTGGATAQACRCRTTRGASSMTP